MIKIQYIGHKPYKTDNLAGTATVWNGHGDVQDVPDDAAPKLLRFPGVWQVAEEVALSVDDLGPLPPGRIEAIRTKPTTGEAVLAELDKAALIARAAELGIKVDGRIGVTKLAALAAQIEEAEASKAG